MTMKGLMEDNKGVKPTPEEVEERFQGNICRCTGCKYKGKTVNTVAADDARIGGIGGGSSGRRREVVGIREYVREAVRGPKPD